jgi:hypothetical protein
MNDIERTALERGRALDRLAAELTDTAYTVALRHAAAGSWIDLELGLRKAPAGTVREWAGKRRLIGGASEGVRTDAASGGP